MRMNRRALNWHKENMEIICSETANKRDSMYIYALAVAVGFILDWINKADKTLGSINAENK